MVSGKIIDSPRKFNNVIHPSSLLGPESCDDSFIRKGLTGKIIVKGMAEIQIVLEKIDMRQNMVENHHVQPVRIVVIVK